jgi:hypothetical protein
VRGTRRGPCLRRLSTHSTAPSRDRWRTGAPRRSTAQGWRTALLRPLSAITCPGCARGRPGPMRSTRIPVIRHVNCVQSLTFPPVTTSADGRLLPSQTRWIPEMADLDEAIRVWRRTARRPHRPSSPLRVLQQSGVLCRPGSSSRERQRIESGGSGPISCIRWEGRRDRRVRPRLWCWRTSPSRPSRGGVAVTGGRTGPGDGPTGDPHLPHRAPRAPPGTSRPVRGTARGTGCARTRHVVL